MKTTLAALMLVGGLIAGCSSSDQSDRSMSDRHAGERADTPSGINDRDSWNRLHSDPVCGMTVNPKQAKTDWYDGDVYYFDSEQCRRKFHDNPTAFVPGHEDLHVADAGARDSRSIYTDPVCGFPVNPKTGLKETYNGTTYWFDSEDCRSNFHKNPSAFVPSERPPKEVR